VSAKQETEDSFWDHNFSAWNVLMNDMHSLMQEF